MISCQMVSCFEFELQLGEVFMKDLCAEIGHGLP
jgi:hypothetical protein